MNKLKLRNLSLSLVMISFFSACGGDNPTGTKVTVDESNSELSSKLVTEPTINQKTVNETSGPCRYNPALDGWYDEEFQSCERK